MDPASLPATWPFRSEGRRIALPPHRWWVVELGPKGAPAVLLLHGTGASNHSFRTLAPELAKTFRVIVPDLPGQGCSQTQAFSRMSLDGMADDLWTLCDALQVKPRAIIGHSAGAAIGLRMAELRPGPAVVGINAALGGFHATAAVIFPIIAKALATFPFISRLASQMSGRAETVDRLLAGTGSTLDAAGRAQYLTLVQDPDHVAGALEMMANWKLDGLLSRLPLTKERVLLIVAEGDRTVPPKVSVEAAARIPGCELIRLPRHGHLVHEEVADGLASLILPWLNRQ